MPLIRCTRRLFKYSRRSPVTDPPASPGLFGEWYANAISLPFRGKWVVLYTHPETRLSIAVPGRSLNTTVAALPERFANLLRRMGVDDETIAEACEPVNDEVILAKTESRSVIGTQTDFGKMLKFHADHVGTLEALDWDKMEDFMARTPITALGLFPYQKARELLDVTAPTPKAYLL